VPAGAGAHGRLGNGPVYREFVIDSSI
jgi:hypothetical protein